MLALQVSQHCPHCPLFTGSELFPHPVYIFLHIPHFFLSIYILSMPVNYNFHRPFFSDNNSFKNETPRIRQGFLISKILLLKLYLVGDIFVIRYSSRDSQGLIFKCIECFFLPSILALIIL